MNRIKFFFFSMLSLTLVQCKSQGKSQTAKTIRIQDSVVITNDFEKFDEARYQRLKTEETGLATETTATGTYVEMDKLISGCSFNETKSHAYFSLLKLYYPNGNIKSKGAYFNVPWGGFKKGVWYEFSEDGKLVKETNYDKDYPFTFENVLAFCKKKSIPLSEGPVKQSTGWHTTVRRNTAAGKAKWILQWQKKFDVIENITLDGNTGTVIQKRENSYANN